MREARHLDLNYGHLGRPVYDSESHEWRFSRVPHITRQLKPIAEPFIALASPSENHMGGSQFAAERRGNVKDLARLFPELQPAASLLPGLAYVSEAVNEITSRHDPTVSELLAFGQVRYGTKYGKTEDIPIVAVAGGSAGDILRLILLTEEQLGWNGEKGVHLNKFSCKGGEESLWRANGSPLQQVTFTESEGQSSSWLAVRYHGAVSILHPRLRLDDSVPKSRSIGARNSRLDPNPVVVLHTQRSRGVQFADVAFNPWNHQQIATVDLDGHWEAWLIQGIAPQRELWTIEKRCGGFIHDISEGERRSHIHGDGWGTVLWTGNPNRYRLLVATRKTLAIFDIRDNATRLRVPKLISRTSSDWILDVKRKPSNSNDIFVATSSTLYWLTVAASDDLEQSAAQCLLSWKHFIDHQDISLRLNVLRTSEELNARSDSPANTVLLYSRLTGLTIVFTLQHPESSPDQALSISDPFLLPVAEWADGILGRQLTHLSVGLTSVPINSIALRTVSYGFTHKNPPSGLGQLYVESEIKFYQLNILFQDLSLSECLYAEAVAGLNLDIHLPSLQPQKGLPKSSAKVFDDFIVPDGSEDENSEAWFDDINAQRRMKLASRSRSAFPDDDARSIPFQSLDTKLGKMVAEYSTISMGDFAKVIMHLYDTIITKGAISDIVMETLLGLARRNAHISDLDKADSDFKDFLKKSVRLTLEDGDANHSSANERLAVSQMLTPAVWKSLNMKADPEVLSVYEGLIETWISPLSHDVPSRTRVSVENLLRKNMLGQVLLASYVVRPDSTEENEYAAQDEPTAAGAQFILPVRGRDSARNLEKGKQPAARSSSPLASSQLSEDVGFLPPSPLRPLPTPEPTPSLRSQSSISSLAGDPASRRLQTYTDLALQPALPVKLSNNLGHWPLGTDPANYDWEAAQQAFASDDEGEVEARTKQRKRAKKHQKRQREPTVGPSSQPTPKRHGSSQPQQVAESTQGSSQATDTMVIASQVEPGRFGGRPSKPRKKKPVGKRPAGFR